MAAASSTLAAQQALIKKAGLTPSTPNVTATGAPMSSTFNPATGTITQTAMNTGVNTAAPVLTPTMPSVPTPTAYQAPDDAGQFAASMLSNTAAGAQAQDQQNIISGNEAQQQAKLEAQQAKQEQDAYNATQQATTNASLANPATGLSGLQPGENNGVENVYDPAKGGGYSEAQWGGNKNLSASRNQALATAFSYMGDPYQLGGTSHQGIDCSGLVMAVYDQFGWGKYLNSHYVPTQMQNIPGYRTSVNNLVPGDIVVWNDGSHIAIYAGNGMIVAAAAPGEGVKYQPVWGNVTGIHIKLPGE